MNVNLSKKIFSRFVIWSSVYVYITSMYNTYLPKYIFFVSSHISISQFWISCPSWPTNVPHENQSGKKNNAPRNSILNINSIFLFACIVFLVKVRFQYILIKFIYCFFFLLLQCNESFHHSASHWMIWSEWSCSVWLTSVRVWGNDETGGNRFMALTSLQDYK